MVISPSTVSMWQVLATLTIGSSANDFSNLNVCSAVLLSPPHPLSRHGSSPPVCLLTAFPGHSDHPSSVKQGYPRLSLPGRCCMFLHLKIPRGPKRRIGENLIKVYSQRNQQRGVKCSDQGQMLVSGNLVFLKVRRNKGSSSNNPGRGETYERPLTGGVVMSRNPPLPRKQLSKREPGLDYLLLFFPLTGPKEQGSSWDLNGSHSAKTLSRIKGEWVWKGSSGCTAPFLCQMA